jgi:hypothetical protein
MGSGWVNPSRTLFQATPVLGEQVTPINPFDLYGVEQPTKKRAIKKGNEETFILSDFDWVKYRPQSLISSS